MKKTITINLNGFVFNIEEDAYHRLNAYLESIKNHYGEREGQEIIADIESSISEKFQEKLNKNKQVVTLKDVEKIIEVMGTVEEIGAEVEAENLANKKEDHEEEQGTKKLYRNMDDVIVAGVCSGLAAYFGIDAVIVRIIFVILIFFNGFGILAYLILWLVMPKALSSAQKLEMQGKPVNLKKLEQVVKKKSQMLKEEGKEAFKKINKNQVVFRRILSLPVEIAERAFSLLRRVIDKAGPALAILIGIAFSVSAFLAIFGLIFASGMLIFNINSPLLVSDIPLGELSQNASFKWLVGLMPLVAGVPMIFLLFLGITLIRRKNSFRLILSLLLIFVWFLSIAGVGISGVKLAPTIQDMAQKIKNREMVSRNYDLEGYNKIRVGGEAKVKVIQGEKYNLQVANDEKNLENFEFKLEDGELTLGQNKRREGICFLCFDEPYEIEITLPRLESFIAYGQVEAEVRGFSEDIKINAGEAAQVKAYLNGQNIESYVAGTSGRINILGSPRKIEAVLEGNGRLDVLELNAQEVNIKQSVLSRVYLGGKTKILNVESDFRSKTYADDLVAQEVNAKAANYARIEVYCENKLKAIAKDHSLIMYLGNPEIIQKVSTEEGVVRGKDYMIK